MFTRIGPSKEAGQMLIKMPTRSGEYAWGIRYKSVGVGVDTERWQVVVADTPERQKRHQAILSALRDTLLSPEGALTATMLPHLTGLRGAVVVRQSVGRAPVLSALADDFVAHLSAMADETTTVYAFETFESFHQVMNHLIQTTEPALPHHHRQRGAPETSEETS